MLKKIILILMLFLSFCFAREYSLAEKYQQLFMLGFRGTTQAEFIDFSQKIPWGGYILYARQEGTRPRNIVSPAQIQALNTSIKGDHKSTAIKPFIAVDNEGGTMQIAQAEGGAFTYFQSPRAVVSDEVQWAKGLAQQLKTNGFSLNLAPVVDVDRGYTNTRSFANTSNVVIARARTFIAQQHAAGLPVTLKHFPGRLTGYEGDIAAAWSKNTDLKPFQELAAEADLVMVSTMPFPGFGTTENAVLNPEVLNCLRKDCNFWGVALTDDLSLLMPPTLTQQEFENKIVALILAGNDLLLLANNNNYIADLPQKVQTAISNIIAQKRIPEQRIEESFRRILTLKKKYGIEPNEIYLNYQM